MAIDRKADRNAFVESNAIQTSGGQRVPKIVNALIILMGLVMILGFEDIALAQSYDRILENFKRTTPLRLEGSAFDNTLVRNCEISNTGTYGIYLKGVKNVRIENCKIHDVSGNGIHLSNSANTENITIINNELYNVGINGVVASRGDGDAYDHKGLKIIGNTFRNIATNGNGGLDHGIYIQATEFLIEGNVVRGVVDGNGISVRSSGVVRGNIVENVAKSGIVYFSDHGSGISDRLVIENNTAVDVGRDYSGRGAIELLSWSTKSTADPVRNYTIRFNTAVSRNTRSYAVRVDPDNDPLNVELYGNLMVAASGSQYLLSGRVDVNDRNYMTTSLSGFKSTTSPFDFHIIDSTHPAIGYATGLRNFSAIDIDGQARSSARLDAGADQVSLATPSPTPTPGPTAPPAATVKNLASMSTLKASSSLDSDHPVDNLFDGCIESSESCMIGSSSTATFTAEFDFGAAYALSSIALFGDAQGTWVSRSMDLQYRLSANDKWSTAFTGLNVFTSAWVSKSMSSLKARYVRVVVRGTNGSNKVQARELKIMGSP